MIHEESIIERARAADVFSQCTDEEDDPSEVILEFVDVGAESVGVSVDRKKHVRLFRQFI